MPSSGNHYERAFVVIPRCEEGGDSAIEEFDGHVAEYDEDYSRRYIPRPSPHPLPGRRGRFSRGGNMDDYYDEDSNRRYTRRSSPPPSARREGRFGRGEDVGDYYGEDSSGRYTRRPSSPHRPFVGFSGAGDSDNYRHERLPRTSRTVSYDKELDDYHHIRPPRHSRTYPHEPQPQRYDAPSAEPSRSYASHYPEFYNPRVGMHPVVVREGHHDPAEAERGRRRCEAEAQWREEPRQRHEATNRVEQWLAQTEEEGRR
ncbi:hypothetical protein BU26DRAFT_520471 [Trematosphaeria pertusa]|uniref:Uncharacterized protein n=1 Tax=Trematosphaeria pertusa TaxID=390896 RepID=A0A6A6IAF5_9PLEO|nr:uncharacterized protein BU26DRAFT_520471 [Trematosphaeria pertusa]KAF2247229.1 hypothetical protein BU26DRAFT_520471 [Trematosphaeria pertusa]